MRVNEGTPPSPPPISQAEAICNSRVLGMAAIRPLGETAMELKRRKDFILPSFSSWITLKCFPPVFCVKCQELPSVRFFILINMPQWEAKIYAL